MAPKHLAVAMIAAVAATLVVATDASARDADFTDASGDVRVWSTQNVTHRDNGIDLLTMHVAFSRKQLLIHTTHKNLNPRNGSQWHWAMLDTNPKNPGPEWTLDYYKGTSAFYKVDNYYQANHLTPEMEVHCGVSEQVALWKDTITSHVPRRCFSDSVKRVRIYYGIFSWRRYAPWRFDYLFGHRVYTDWVWRGSLGH